jgi:hypothetical protein
MRNFPSGCIPSYEFSPDGDKIIQSITYPTIDGKVKTVGYEYTLDGDRVPKTGRTIAGDHYFPNSILGDI